jgi:hypothetical protein
VTPRTDGKVCDVEPTFKSAKIGLTPVAQVASYKGPVFGTFDPDAPPLEEFLGPFNFYLDVMLDNDEGGTEFVGGCLKSTNGVQLEIPGREFCRRYSACLLDAPSRRPGHTWRSCRPKIRGLGQPWRDRGAARFLEINLRRYGAIRKACPAVDPRGILEAICRLASKIYDIL